MTKVKLSKVKQWEMDHPDDRPCPTGPTAAKAWKIKRGMYKEVDTFRNRRLWEKYDALMDEKWAAQQKQQQQP